MERNKKKLSLFANVLMYYSLFISLPLLSQSPSSYVNPFIGTGGHGHTFPGAVTPFGMVQLSPDTRNDGTWDGCSGYHYSDSIIYGFSHTHLSGTGCSDWGDFLFVPVMNEPTFDPKKYSSTFSHKNEKAEAGYYSVVLDKSKIKVELTATPRVGLQRYTFSEAGDVFIILDLNHRDKLTNGFISLVSDTTFELWRESEGWTKKQSICGRLEFSKHPDEFKIISSGSVSIGAWFKFKVKKGESILLKVAVSNVDHKGTRLNMEELFHWDFNKVKEEAQRTWDKELGKIKVEDPNTDKLAIFYTALYHCMIHPSLANDVDGRYRGMDNKIYRASGFDYYNVFSLWDTFRALHPLLTLIDEKRTLDFIKTFLEMYKQTGRLPVWELSGNETDCMIGYHAVSVIADAYRKGIKDFDTQLALKAMIEMSNLKDYRGIMVYREKGFLEMGDESESVSKTLEYAYNDWCIAQFAKELKDEELYLIYMDRAQSWKNLYDPVTGFMRPRENGGFLKGFDPSRVDNNFTEANSWQYSFFVPHDPRTLINTMGGDKKFGEKLEQLFTTNSKTTGRDQADITGLIGQYAHGNEPSHHMAYFYNYADLGRETQDWVRKICDEFYKNSPDGLIGNEDCGQMSAWYVMSSLGFYSFCPGNPEYSLGSPDFSSAEILLNNGKRIVFKAKDWKEEYKCVNSYKWNDKHITYPYTVSHAELLNGGILQFEMSQAPKMSGMQGHHYGKTDYSGTNNIPIPYFESSGGKVFRDSLLLSLNTADTALSIWYRTDKDLSKAPKRYKKPFWIYTSSELTAYAELKDASKASKFASAIYFKHPHPEWKISIASKYNPQYTAGGDDGIIDGLFGESDWRKGGWQGYQGQDFLCVIDLGKVEVKKEFVLSVLEDSRSWIYYPKGVELEGSIDGINFKSIGSFENKKPSNEMILERQQMRFQFAPGTSLRYIRIKVKNYGKLPAWHFSVGEDAFIFIDEIIIR